MNISLCIFAFFAIFFQIPNFTSRRQIIGEMKIIGLLISKYHVHWAKDFNFINTIFIFSFADLYRRVLSAWPGRWRSLLQRVLTRTPPCWSRPLSCSVCPERQVNKQLRCPNAESNCSGEYFNSERCPN